MRYPAKQELAAALTASQKLNSALCEQLQLQRQQSENPRSYIRESARLFDIFLTHVPQMSCVKRDVVHKTIRVAVLGDVSTGKSTTLNAYLNVTNNVSSLPIRRAKTGRGSVTTDIECVGTHVHEGTSIHFFDVPGQESCETGSIELVEVLANFHMAILLYKDTPDYIGRLSRILIAMGRPTLFVRSHLDNIDEDERGWEQELHSDREKIRHFTSGTSTDPIVVGISARNVMYNQKQSAIAKVANSFAYDTRRPHTTQLPTFQWQEFVKVLHRLAVATAKVGEVSPHPQNLGEIMKIATTNVHRRLALSIKGKDLADFEQLKVGSALGILKSGQTHQERYAEYCAVVLDTLITIKTKCAGQASNVRSVLITFAGNDHTFRCAVERLAKDATGIRTLMDLIKENPMCIDGLTHVLEMQTLGKITCSSLTCVIEWVEQHNIQAPIELI